MDDAQAPQKTIWTLTAHGYRRSQIARVWRDYCSFTDPSERSDNDFIRFAQLAKRPSASSAVVRAPSPDWSPAGSTIASLKERGITESAIREHLPVWMLYTREKGAVIRNWDAAFKASVIRQHEMDSGLVGVDDFTPEELCTSSPGWQPGIDQLLAEFKLYWRDRGCRKSLEDWRVRFLAFITRDGRQPSSPDSGYS